jgi:hypothetical protein
MKNRIKILFIFIIILVGFTGCTGQNALADGQQVESGTSTPVNSIPKNSATNSSEMTLAEIRKAAENAGYNVSDGHQLVFMDEVTDGFTVQIVADDQDVRYSVIQCKTEDAAIKNAKAIDDAGYNISIRNGKILSCYGVDKKDGTSKEILASIVAGKPIASK